MTYTGLEVVLCAEFRDVSADTKISLVILKRYFEGQVDGNAKVLRIIRHFGRISVCEVFPK